MMTVAATIKLDLDDDEEPKKEEKEGAAEASTREEQVSEVRESQIKGATLPPVLNNLSLNCVC